MEKVESNPVCGSFEDAWKTNELILDAILKYLTVQEVKMFRLVSKSWSAAGARPLVRNTLIRLTAIVNLKPVSEKVPILTAHNSPDSDFWQCECQMDNEIFEYSHIDAYSEYLESAAFNSGFAPKNLSVATSFDVWKLPIAHFSWLETLEVVTFRPSQGLKLLNEFHLMFPNLKSLQLRYIQPEAEVPEAGVIRPSDDTKGSNKILLETLAITVSSDWKYSGPEVLHRFKKLKSLTLHWAGRYPVDGWRRRPVGLLNRLDFNSVQYIDWLQGPEFPVKFSLLTDMSLRLDLLPSTSAAARQVLNGMTLKKLSLDLYGNMVEFSEFILGLSSKTIGALTSVHSACLWFEGRGDEMHPSIVWLGDNGFFSKSEWALTFSVGDIQPGWVSFARTGVQFRLLASRRLQLAYIRVLPNIVLKYLEELSCFSYNYSYRRFRLSETVVRYAYERMSPENVFHFPYQPHCKAYVGSRATGKLVHQMTVTVQHFAENPICCHAIPKFRQEAGLDSPADDYKHGLRTFTTFVMCTVKADIVDKWSGMQELKSEDSVIPDDPPGSQHFEGNNWMHQCGR